MQSFCSVVAGAWPLRDCRGQGLVGILFYRRRRAIEWGWSVGSCGKWPVYETTTSWWITAIWVVSQLDGLCRRATAAAKKQRSSCRHCSIPLPTKFITFLPLNCLLPYCLSEEEEVFCISERLSKYCIFFLIRILHKGKQRTSADIPPSRTGELAGTSNLNQAS